MSADASRYPLHPELPHQQFNVIGNCLYSSKHAACIILSWNSWHHKPCLQVMRLKQSVHYASLINSSAFHLAGRSRQMKVIAGGASCERAFSLSGFYLLPPSQLIL